MAFLDIFFTRITPAYAGKSSALFISPSPMRDHPRIRGEKLHPFSSRLGLPGSPPHTRGKAGAVFSCAKRSGITPAYAGKRYTSPLFIYSVWDHPRIRGEKSSPTERGWLIPGSPPHTRGKGGHEKRRQESTGITPAYAGKSILSWGCPS